MDVILENGRPLYQSFVKKSEYAQGHSPYDIYGDDFRVAIAPTGDSCFVMVRDYDESHETEKDINFTLNRNELKTFIFVLTQVLNDIT